MCLFFFFSFFFNDCSGIWEIMCAERCWLSGEREWAGDLLRPPPQNPLRDKGNTHPMNGCVCVHKCSDIHTDSTAVFGQSALVCDLCFGRPGLSGPREGAPAKWISSYFLISFQSQHWKEKKHVLRFFPVVGHFSCNNTRLSFLKESLVTSIGT